MKRTTRRKASAVLLAGGCSLGIAGGSCLPDDFWITQWENTLTAAVDTFVADTIVVAIDDAFAQE